ncbi:MAG: 16S rRNA (cytosine(1402)-N(4))-methyltransferase RsmH [Amoebophilaceae bacterium]|nr:16S rRNA (cytosine(1402)-N(4))-methyltransferase RsmH [Amoebophilaceae bacterium]
MSIPVTINTPYHIPVMVDEVIQGLSIVPTGHYADATFGGGGHAKKIIDCLSQGHLFAFDKDPAAAEVALSFTSPLFTFTRAPFVFIKEFLDFYGITQLDGLLADLGTSSHQIDRPERGFSTRFDGILDMRMDPDATHTAGSIIHTYSEGQLAHLFYKYGEIAQGSAMARAIVIARKHAPITTTHALIKILQPFAPHAKENQYFAKAFQALRIEVNNELDELAVLLECSLEIIKPGGRLAIISYHSLEDRWVKNFLHTGNILGQLQKDAYGNPLRPFIPLQKKPYRPTEEEIDRNNRSRSARLRIGIRTT